MQPDEARRVAENMLGRPADLIEPFHPAVGGNDSFSFCLAVAGERMLLKVKKRPGSPVGVCFYDRIRDAGVPAPELIAFDATGGPGGRACAIWQWIDGTPAEWGQGRPCPYDEAEFGRLLRRIHELRFDGPVGFLGDDLTNRSFTVSADIAPTADRWGSLFLCDRAARRYLDKGYLTPHEANTLALLPERLDGDLDVADARLLHMGDIMHNGNMIVDPADGRILAVVDYVESMAGDPRYELAWVDYYFGQYPFNDAEFDMAAFRQGYGATHDPLDPAGRFYLLAILIFEKLLFFKPDSPHGQWAIQTVKDLLAGFAGRIGPQK